jgi:hypothetical protein
MIENNDVRIDENKKRCKSVSCRIHNMELTSLQSTYLYLLCAKRAKAGA